MKESFAFFGPIVLFHLLLLPASCKKGDTEKDRIELLKIEKSKEVRASLEGDIIFINNSMKLEKAQAKSGGSRTIIGSSPSNIVGPKWSRDGSKVAFIKIKGDPIPNQNWYLAIVSPAGAEQHEWLLGPASQLVIKAVTWSPEGNDIAILTDANKIIYIEISTGHLTETSLLLNNTYCRSLAWWPNGDKIAVSAVSGGVGNITSSIWMVRAYENNPQMDAGNLLFSAGGSIEYLDWSRDGSKLVYSEYSFISSIYVVNHDGTGNRKIILKDLYKDETLVGYAPCWSSDNEKIIYVGSTGVSGSTLIPGLFVTDISGSYKVDIKIPGVFPDWF